MTESKEQEEALKPETKETKPILKSTSKQSLETILPPSIYPERRPLTKKQSARRVKRTTLESIATSIESQIFHTTKSAKNEEPIDELCNIIDKLESIVDKTNGDLSSRRVSLAQEEEKAKFIEFEIEEEEEFIELLRRCAELAVRGECADAALSSLRRESTTSSNDDTQEDETATEIINTSTRSLHTFEELSEQELEAHLTLFDTFCERNVLNLIINIATGAAFKSKTIPPLGIATQAVQSVAILVQNVTSTTSLYYLLSNNYINHLINFPLDLYTQASNKVDIAELNTNFISFLKSLAMRITTQTLQFFLSTTDNGTEFPLYVRALEFCSIDHDSFVRVTAMNICLNILRLATHEDVENDTPKTNKYNLNKVVLPKRDKILIAKHVTCPKYVELLLSPIYSRLASLSTDLEENIRNLDKVQQTSSLYLYDPFFSFVKNKKKSDNGFVLYNTNARLPPPPSHPKPTTSDTIQQKKYIKYTQQIQNIIADLQDELLLLDDVLKVGLICLNEQAIEMMLATYIYPFLLQPLLFILQSQQNSNDNKNMVHPYYLKSEFKNQTVEYANLKTAYICISSVFTTITNKTLLSLLFTALFHPYAPDAFGGSVISTVPNVLDENGDIRMDFKGTSLDYLFGRNTTNQENKENEYIYVLAPALSYILHQCTPKEEFILRSNKYKKAILETLVKNAEDLNLKQIAIFSINNSFCNYFEKCGENFDLLAGGDIRIEEENGADVFDGLDCLLSLLDEKRDKGIWEIIKDKNTNDKNEPSLESIIECKEEGEEKSNIENGNDKGQEHKNDNVNQFLHEMVYSLCYSVMSASIYINGIWRLDYNPTAAHSLLLLLQYATRNKSILHTILSILQKLQQKSSCYISNLPSCIMQLRQDTTDTSFDEDQINIIMDDIILNTVNTFKSSISLTTKFETIIATKTSFHQIFDLLSFGNNYYHVLHRKHLLFILSNSSSYTSSMLNKEKMGIVKELFMYSVMSMLQLDCFIEYLRSYSEHDASSIENPFSLIQDTMSTLHYSSSFEEDATSHISTNADSLKQILKSKLSSKLNTTFLEIDEDYRMKHTSENLPVKQLLKTGTVVSLVGRAAFPCVCEVSEQHSPLFQDAHACVIADGIKWQSLYLVILGKYMLLAEPERRLGSGSSGNGRVVTSCQLSCLDIQKDKPSVVHTSSARRLLLIYYSFDKDPPGVFTLETNQDNTINSNGDESVLFHSRMDLWFEDEDSADSAYEALCIKVNKAKSKRGRMLRDAFNKL